MSTDENVYTRGGPIRPRDASRRAEAGEFIWRSADRRFFPLANIEDDHLLNIELHLMGRSSYRKPSGYGPGNPRWENTYTIIRDEIERRELMLKESTGAVPKADEEEFHRYGDMSRFPEGELNMPHRRDN